MLRGAPQAAQTYAWSIPTLDRRLRYFNIFYTDRNVTLDEVKEAVGKELEGPGKLLGYRAPEHLLNVLNFSIH